MTNFLLSFVLGTQVSEEEDGTLPSLMCNTLLRRQHFMAVSQYRGAGPGPRRPGGGGSPARHGPGWGHGAGGRPRRPLALCSAASFLIARVCFIGVALGASDLEEQKSKNPQNRGQISSFGFCFSRTGLGEYLRACNTTLHVFAILIRELTVI